MRIQEVLESVKSDNGYSDIFIDTFENFVHNKFNKSKAVLRLTGDVFVSDFDVFLLDLLNTNINISMLIEDIGMVLRSFPNISAIIHYKETMWDTPIIKFIGYEVALCYPKFSIYVTSMQNLFKGYYETELDVSKFDTRNVLDMKEMFSKCKNLKILDLSSFSTTKLKDATYMFHGCCALEFVDMRNFGKQDLSRSFYDCVSLRGSNHPYYEIKDLRI